MNLDYVEGDTADMIMKEGHFWISDDKEHDTIFVQHYFQKPAIGYKKEVSLPLSTRSSRMAAQPNLNPRSQYTLLQGTMD
jgi:hypothetical protein